ncbi:flagellar hook-basal body protein [Sutcliffiella horikoshii]|uniref:Flagellar hook-basal body protein n=1 Tax=Sutcliffiella horikoshii TaxID=79883 RepID=A0A5D4T5N9_9BACI|nr:flagellar hook-basal body protein [Sutcliffiella horikoshii]TYS70018.1 flagellar hook-basal body protein [Sutcliffiella horikoshii]
MLRGFHTATAGMLSQQRRMEMLSNNLSNSNTPGYKADQSSLRAFPELLLKRMEQANIPTTKPISFTQNQTIGGLHTGVYLQETAPKHTQGDMRPTGNQTDLAILNQTLPEGASIFFTVENQDGTPRYTRNGNFAVDQQGYLTTNNGLYVLDENNNRIQMQSDTFELQQDGTILENGNFNTRIGIALAPNANALSRDNNGLYRLNEGEALPNANNVSGTAFRLLQGHIERSNVDTAQTMSDMTAAFRAFEANQKIIKAYDMSMQKAANEIGRIN